jgi:hypothetical protein
MKLKFGAIVTDGRGKIGGHVMSKNRGGAYMRTKVTPSNPRSTAQTTVRSHLTTLSQGWRGLTATAIAAWNSAVSSFTKTNIFGDIHSPSGLNLYVKLNANLLEVGAATIGLPPLPTSVTAPLTIAAAAAAGAATFTVSFTVSPVPANHVWIVRATKQVSAGKSAIKNLYRDVQYLAAAVATGVSVEANYIAKFGALVAGQKIGVEITAVNLTTGQKSIALSTTIIVAA